MPVLEPVVATLIANTAQFVAAMAGAEGQVIGFGAASEAAAVKGATGFKGALSGGISKVSQALGKAGLPLGPLTDGLDKAALALNKVDTASKSTFQKFAGAGKIATIGLGAAAAGLGYQMFKAHEGLEEATSTIANTAGVSYEAAHKITMGFLNMGIKTTASGEEMATAYADVSGQLGSMAGHTLTAAEATKVMAAASDLAIANGDSLASTTKALADTMLAFGLSTKDAVHATDVLDSTADATGTSVSAVASSLSKMKSRLGATAPSLDEMAGLMSDMTKHGISGRMAVGALAGAFTTFLKPSDAAAKAAVDLNIATKNLDPSMKSMASNLINHKMTMQQAKDATKNMTEAQQKTWGAYIKAASGMDAAKTAQDKLGISTTDSTGKLLPMSNILEQLKNRVKGMSDAQAIGTLKAIGFGGQAAKLLGIVRDGGKGFDEAKAKVTENGAAHEAAQLKMESFGNTMKMVKANVENLVGKMAEALAPTVKHVADMFAKFVNYLVQHKGAMIALASVIGGVLVAAIGAYIASLIVAGVNSVIQFGKMIAAGAKWVAETAIQFAKWLAMNAIKIALYASIAIAATAAFVAENLATLGIIAGIALLVGAIIWMATHWKQVWGFVKSVALSVWHFLTSVFNGIVGVIKTAWDFIKKHLTVVMGIILGVMTGGIGLLVILVIKNFDKIKRGISIVWNAILSFLKAIPGKIIDIFKGAISWLGHIGMDILQGLWNGLKMVWQGIVFWYVEMPKKILRFFVTAIVWLHDTGIKLLKGLWNGMVAGAKFLWDWFSSLPGKIWGWVKNAGKWLWDAGANIIHGLVKGIKNGVKHAIDAIKHVGHSIVHAFTSFFGIFSPSKKFAGYGKNMMEGLHKGIKDNKDLAGAELKSLKMGKKLEKEFNAIGKAGKHMGDVLKFVGESLRAVADGGAYAKGKVQPAGDAIRTIARALKDAGAMKMSKTFGENLKSLSVVATSLRPGPITQGIHAIVDGLKKIGTVDVRPSLHRNELAFASFVTHSKPVKAAFLSLGTQIGHTSKTIDGAKGKWNGMRDTLKDSKNNAHDLNQTLKDIRTNLNSMGSSVKTATKALGPDLKKALNQNAEVAKAIQPTFNKVADAISKSADKVKESVDNWKAFGNAMKSSKDDGKSLSDAMDKVKGSTDHVRDAIKRIIDNFKALKATIRDTFKDSKQWFANLGAQMMHGLVDGIKSGINGVVLVLNRVSKAMSDMANTYKESMAEMAAASNTMMDLLGMGSGKNNKMMSLGSARARTGGQMLQVTTPIQIDGKTIATVVTKYQLQGSRGTGNALGRYAGGNQTGGATGLSPNRTPR